MSTVKEILDAIISPADYYRVVKDRPKTKLVPTKYYLVNFRVIHKPFILRRKFDNREQATTFMERYIGYRPYGYTICKGLELMEYDLPFKNPWFKEATSKYPLTQNMGFYKKRNMRRQFRYELRKKNMERLRKDLLRISWVLPEWADTPLLQKRFRRKAKRKLVNRLIPLES